MDTLDRTQEPACAAGEDRIASREKPAGNRWRTADISVLKEKLMQILYGGEPEPDFDDSVFAMHRGRGRELHRAFTDEELLHYLRDLAERLNHPPSQKEVHWAMKDYIKIRFKRWPYALEKAGLARSAGSGGKSMDAIHREEAHRQEMLDAIRESAIRTGRLPHPRDFPEICEELRQYYSDWSQVLKEAGVEASMLNKMAVHKIDDLEPEYVEMLEQVRAYAYKVGRSPIHGEVEDSIKQRLIDRCGSWRNALYQIGLEPVIRCRSFRGIYVDKNKTENREYHTEELTDCCYRVLNLTEQDRKDLAQVKGIWVCNQKIPGKKDVPKELRQRLKKSCGSWVNTLYQLGIQPKDYYKSMDEEARKRKDEQKKKQQRKQSKRPERKDGDGVKEK